MGAAHGQSAVCVFSWRVTGLEPTTYKLKVRCETGNITKIDRIKNPPKIGKNFLEKFLKTAVFC
jgi:hypothetical protein